MPFCRIFGNGENTTEENCIFAAFSASRAVWSRVGLSHCSKTYLWNSPFTDLVRFILSRRLPGFRLESSRAAAAAFALRRPIAAIIPFPQAVLAQPFLEGARAEQDADQDEHEPRHLHERYGLAQQER